ncbi:symplekin-like [Lineus longissimus]|uniref:symplekin-like n=1 Tax=Lineus longissimus TaxID=88925 RepID=UPI002B4D189B
MAAESRRCTASQFFQDEEAATLEGMSIYDRVVDLLNQASLMQKDAQKLNNLKQVQELIIRKDPNLLDNFLDEMLAFQTDKSVDVKKFIVCFMEEACKVDNEVLYKVIGNLNMLLEDENVNVQKRVILSMTQLYKIALQWVVRSKAVSDLMIQTWHYICKMKDKIISMLESENDGIRTHAVKFVETVIITLSEKTEDSDVPQKYENNISLDQIPPDHRTIDIKKMEREGVKAFETLLDFEASAHISSVNLITTMSSLTMIGKQRPQFIAKVIQGFESLHVNLPPTLAKSQVSSVRKNLKMQLLQLLKHPGSYDFRTHITTLLTDLGATNAEVMKALPKVDERKRKMDDQEPSSSNANKKQKVDVPPSAMDDEDIVPISQSKSKQPESKIEIKQVKLSPIDVTTEDIMPKLTPENVADLVLVSMVMLPETMPPTFQATYTPIAAAGTDGQISHMARLLANQFHAVGLGKGTELASKEEAVQDAYDEEEEDVARQSSIQTLVGGSIHRVDKPEARLPVSSSQSTSSRKGIKQFKLSLVTRPMDPAMREEFALDAYQRILAAEKNCGVGNASMVRSKVLSSLAAMMGLRFKEALLDYIFADLRNRTDLAFDWLYQEYSNRQGYIIQSVDPNWQKITSYDECLTRLLSGLLERPDQREGLFSRLLLEAPRLTANAIGVLKQYCQDETRIYLGMSTLKELILKRPTHKVELLNLLLEFAANENPEVRNNAMRMIKVLHERQEMESFIERHAQMLLKDLLMPAPTAEIFHKRSSGMETQDAWTEESIKICLYLYLGLMPINHKLIHELAAIYTSTSADVKRIILRVLEAPVKGMGMDSPELLLLVENCPKGAETLVTRIIHILTDKAVPSPELVDRVRDLYHKRVADVRFLIPVLNGLSKKEVIAALPRLIKLNPNVVKEVFNRLLGGHGDSSVGYASPLNPAELLVALHNIDPLKCDMKTIIKATNLCFAEKTVYTQEVLAVVMQQLMEQNPLPVLLMRTVIQALAMYPRLVGFTMNILQRLIIKEVWTQKKVWEGFIKCCQRTRPQSFVVLLQLPAAQLSNVFETCPEMKEPLHQHVLSLAPNQRAHLPRPVLAVLENRNMEEMEIRQEAEIENIQPRDLNSEATRFVVHQPKLSIPSTPPISTITHPSMPKMEVQDHLRAPTGQSPVARQQVSTISTIGQPSPDLQNVTTIQTVQTIQPVPQAVHQPTVQMEEPIEIDEKVPEPVPVPVEPEKVSAQHNLAVRTIQQVPGPKRSVPMAKPIQSLSGRASQSSSPMRSGSESESPAPLIIPDSPKPDESAVKETAMEVAEPEKGSVDEKEVEIIEEMETTEKEVEPEPKKRGRKKASATPTSARSTRSTRSSKK